MVGREGSTTTFSLGAFFDRLCFLGFGSSVEAKSLINFKDNKPL